MSRGFTVSGFYVWSRALESSNPVENGWMSAQDFGVLGKPFTATNNSWAPSAAAFRKNMASWIDNHDSNAAISGMWNIDYFHGSNKIVEGSGQRLADLTGRLFDQRRAVYGVHGIQQEL